MCWWHAWLVLPRCARKLKRAFASEIVVRRVHWGAGSLLFRLTTSLVRDVTVRFNASIACRRKMNAQTIDSLASALGEFVQCGVVGDCSGVHSTAAVAQPDEDWFCIEAGIWSHNGSQPKATPLVSLRRYQYWMETIKEWITRFHFCTPPSVRLFRFSCSLWPSYSLFSVHWRYLNAPSFSAILSNRLNSILVPSNREFKRNPLSNVHNPSLCA